MMSQSNDDEERKTLHKRQRRHEDTTMRGSICRNPNLAKCGGEAQHLEELGIWSPPGLPDV